MTDYERYVQTRNAMNYKDADVARLAGIPASTFSDWKKGKSSPKAEKLIKIANVLNVHYTDLINNESGIEKDVQIDKSNCLSKEEYELIEAFRKLTPDEKHQFQMMLLFLLSQNKDK